MPAPQALRLACPCGTACRLRDCVLFTAVEPPSLNVLKVTQLLGGDVGIRLLVHLGTKALALSILGPECHQRGPEHKPRQTALPKTGLGCQLTCGGRRLALGKVTSWSFPYSVSSLSAYTRDDDCKTVTFASESGAIRGATAGLSGMSAMVQPGALPRNLGCRLSNNTDS